MRFFLLQTFPTLICLVFGAQRERFAPHQSVSCMLALVLWALGLCTAAFSQHAAPEAKQLGNAGSFEFHRMINDVFQDPEKRVWVVTSDQIFRYDGVEMTPIRTNTVGHRALLRGNIGANGQKFVIDYSGRIFFIESDSLRAYAHNDTLAKFNKHHVFFGVQFDEAGVLHISIAGTGYIRIDPTGKVEKPFEQITGERPNYYTAIFDQHGVPFLSLEPRTKESKPRIPVFSICNEKLEIIDSAALSKTKLRFPYACIQLANGNFLLSTGKQHLIEFNAQQIVRSWEYEVPIIRMIRDQSQGIWISTHEDGIHHYPDGQISPENLRRLLYPPHALATLADHEGGIWINTKNKLFHISHPAERMYGKKSGMLDFEAVSACALVDNHLWIIGPKGELAVFDPKTMQQKPTPIQFREIGPAKTIHHDTINDRVWATMSKAHKVFYRSGNRWKEPNLEALGSKPEEFRHYIQFSTTFKGEYYSAVGFSGNRFYMIRDTAVEFVSPAFPSKISKIIVVHDSVWVNTVEGLHLYANGKIQDSEAIDPLHRKLVLTMAYFNQKLWISLRNNKLYTWSRGRAQEFLIDGKPVTESDLILPNKDHLWLLTPAAGYLIGKSPKHKDTLLATCAPISRSVKAGSTLNGTSLFSLREFGVAQIDFEDIKAFSIQPPVTNIQELRINKQLCSPLDTAFQLDYNEGFIQISYIGLSYQGKKVLYRHRMKGLEDDWTYTDETYTQYTTLPPGDYAFEVQSQKELQHWSAPKRLHFAIAPPFWETWWFILVSSALVLGLSYWLVSWRLKTVKREQDLLIDRLRAEQKVLLTQMDPHYTFNVISSLQYLIEQGDKQKTKRFLQMFSQSLRSMLDQARKQDITLREEVRFLGDYIEMERFRLEDRFDFMLDTTHAEPFFDQRIPLFLIQPVVENAIRHGLHAKLTDGRLKLAFSVENNWLTVTIEDNGVGRKASGKLQGLVDTDDRKSHGITITQERLQLHNQTKNNMHIEDLFDADGKPAGTRVSMRIRLIQP